MDNETQHSEDFIKDFTQSKNPFNTPENYFDDLSERLFTASVESELPNDTGFTVPKNYFEEFKVKRPKNKLVQLFPYISIAACLMIGVFLFKNMDNASSVELKDENIISYLTYEEGIEYDEIISNITINENDFIDDNLDTNYINIDEFSEELKEYDVINF